MPPEFSSPANFRASVDQRLRNYARAADVPVVAVRRQASLERLMARLMKAAPDRWAPQGRVGTGYASWKPSANVVGHGS